MDNAELLKLIEARQEILLEQAKNLDFRQLLDGDKDFEDDYVELCWRFNELVRCFLTDDVSLMRSAVKLSSRHCAEIVQKFVSHD